MNQAVSREDIRIFLGELFFWNSLSQNSVKFHLGRNEGDTYFTAKKSLILYIFILISNQALKIQ